jgi:uncharacterized membrane protein
MIWTVLIHIIAALGYATGAIWGIVEGVDYFVNEDPVNWWFLLPLVGGIVTLIVNFFYAAFYKR